MKIKSIKAITLSMPFSHGGKKVIFHGKEWKSLEFNLVKVETDKGIIGWGEAFGYTSWKAVKIAIEEMVAPLLIGKDMSNICLLYTSPSPRDSRKSRMPSSA